MNITNVFGVAVCALCAVIFSALIKKSNKEYGVLLSTVVVVILCLFVLDKAQPLISEITELSSGTELGGDYLPTMLKALGIAIVGQITCQICKDTGESALSYTVDLAAKTAVLTVCLPILLTLVEALGEIIKL